MSIFVSAGHSQADPGAVYLGFLEHTEAMRWRNEVVRAGELLGAPFEAVPEGSLKWKVAYVNERCAAVGHSVALELHFNAGGTPGQTRGCETLYAPRSSRGAVLAELVQDSLETFFPSSSGRSRGTKEAWYRQDHPHRIDYPGDVDGDEVPDYFCVKTVCPAVIVEPEFIYERLAIQARRDDACRAIAVALVQAHRLLCP